jgi:hypothetical protein
MNQIICPRCQTPNGFDKSFCTNCGQPIAIRQPAFSQQIPNHPPPPAAKKSRLGLWIAILGGTGLVILLIGGLGLVGLYFFIKSGNTQASYNYNAPVSEASQSTSSPPWAAADTTKKTETAAAAAAPAMTEDEKYRLFYASGKVNDQAIIMKVSKKIGIIDSGGLPTSYYKTFSEGMIKWAFRDTDFVKKVDTKEKARNYINSQMPEN